MEIINEIFNSNYLEFIFGRFSTRVTSHLEHFSRTPYMLASSSFLHSKLLTND